VHSTPLLWPQDRWPLTLLVLALSAAHVLVARLVPPPKPANRADALALCRLALTLPPCLPIRLDGKWITLAFAVEGAILVWTGFRSMNRPPARWRLFPSRARRRPATDFLASTAISVQRAIRRLCRPDPLLRRSHLRRARTRLLGRPDELNALGVFAVASTYSR